MKLTHIRLLVNNYRDCFFFYRDVLGFEVGWGDENSDYADFHAGTAQLAIFSRREMAEAIGTAHQPSFAESQDRVAVIFAVENVDAKFRQLRDKGVSFVTEPHDRNDWGIRVAHFRDPDGNLIEINQSI